MRFQPQGQAVMSQRRGPFIFRADISNLYFCPKSGVRVQPWFSTPHLLPRKQARPMVNSKHVTSGPLRNLPQSRASLRGRVWASRPEALLSIVCLNRWALVCSPVAVHAAQETLSPLSGDNNMDELEGTMTQRVTAPTQGHLLSGTWASKPHAPLAAQDAHSCCLVRGPGLGNGRWRPSSGTPAGRQPRFPESCEGPLGAFRGPWTPKVVLEERADLGSPPSQPREPSHFSSQTSGSVLPDVSVCFSHTVQPGRTAMVLFFGRWHQWPGPPFLGPPWAAGRLAWPVTSPSLPSVLPGCVGPQRLGWGGCRIAAVSLVFHCTEL